MINRKWLAIDPFQVVSWFHTICINLHDIITGEDNNHKISKPLPAAIKLKVFCMWSVVPSHFSFVFLIKGSTNQCPQMTAGLASPPGCIKIGQPEHKDHLQLDRVIVPADGKAHQSPWRKRVETVAVILLGFALNISMAISTKWIFIHGDLCNVTECVQYKFPVAITVIHMIFSWCLCGMYIFHVRGEHESRLTLQEQISEILPLSICFALSVAMGNMSLKFIYPSFNQMLGSMSPLVTVLLAVLVQGKSFSFKTWISMPVICVGLAICSLKEVNFNALGTFYAVGSMVLRAAKTLIQGKLLQHKMDSISLLYYMAPMSAGIFICFDDFYGGTWTGSTFDAWAKWRQIHWSHHIDFLVDYVWSQCMPSEFGEFFGHFVYITCDYTSLRQCKELSFNRHFCGHLWKQHFFGTINGSFHLPLGRVDLQSEGTQRRRQGARKGNGFHTGGTGAKYWKVGSCLIRRKNCSKKINQKKSLRGMISQVSAEGFVCFGWFVLMGVKSLALWRSWDKGNSPRILIYIDFDDYYWW